MTDHRWFRTARWLALPTVLLGGCAPAATMENGEMAPQAPASGQANGRDTQTDLIPAGHGTLRQDQLTIPLRAGPLLIKITPLDEAIIRLAAPDTYRRLHLTAESKRPEALRATFGSEPEMLLVSFFSYEPDAAYRPEELQIMHRGQILRPAIVLPVTTGWGRERLQQQELQSAVYVFDQQIDYDLPVTVRYEMEQSDHWRDVISVLERERASVRARAGASRP